MLSKAIAKNAIMLFCEKPNVKFPVNTGNLGKTCLNFFVPEEKMASETLKADLGSVSIMLSNVFRREMKAENRFLEQTFLHKPCIANTSSRAKSAGSIFSKIEKGIKRDEVFDYDSAKAFITDGKGLRVDLKALPALNKSTINRMMSEMTIEGRRLSREERALLKKYIYSENTMTQEEIKRAFPIFEKFIIPLVEKHSKPVFDEIQLSMLKYRILNENLTIAQIREQGLLSDNLIKRLTNEKIIPRHYEILNNYRGEYGIPIFSNRQIQLLRKSSGNKLIVHSRPDMLDYSRHPQTIVSNAELGIKDSGYQGGQFKLFGNAEEQFRGVHVSRGAEKEHASYDAVQGKFVSAAASEHVSALKTLSKSEKKIYEEYISKWYNTWARQDLGLPYQIPELPQGLNKTLSMEYIEKMHEQSLLTETAAVRNFVPHLESIT